MTGDGRVPSPRAGLPGDEARGAALGAPAYLDRLVREAWEGATAVGVAVLDVDLRHIEANLGWASLGGRTPAEMPGLPLVEAVPGLAHGLVPLLRRVVATGRPMVTARVAGRVVGSTAPRHWSLTALPAPGRSEPIEAVVLLAAEITDRVQAERRSEEVRRLGDALAEALTTDDVSAVVRHHLPEMLDAWSANLALVRPDGRTVDFLQMDDGFAPSAVEAWRTFRIDDDAPIAEAIRTGRASYQRSRAEFLAGRPHLVEPARDSDANAWASLPMVVSGHVIGALGLRWRYERSFSAAERTFLRTIAAQCAQALDRARLHDQVHRTARALQRSLLPRELPEVPGVQVAVAYEPAEGTEEVGGDVYDVFACQDGWAFVVGDVCGRGAGAASRTGMARHTLRALLPTHGPADSLYLLNRLMLADDGDRCLTVVLAMWRPDAGGGGELVVASAGHPLPVLVRDGVAREVGVPGTILGMLPDVEVTETVVRVRPGDVLAMYTDGITESRGRRDMYGDERLHTVLASAAGEGAQAQDVVDLVCHDVLAHRDPAALGDDAALLVLRVLDPPAR